MTESRPVDPEEADHDQELDASKVFAKLSSLKGKHDEDEE